MQVKHPYTHNNKIINIFKNEVKYSGGSTINIVINITAIGKIVLVLW